MPLRPTSRGQTSTRIIKALATSGAKSPARLEPLDQGREAFGRRAWGSAYAQLSAADCVSPLTTGDLERFAVAAYLAGRDQECGELWARAHQELIAQGDVERAARCAFWLGMTMFDKGQSAPGMGWIARARSMLDDHQRDCVERGYLLLPVALGSLAQGTAASSKPATKSSTSGVPANGRRHSLIGVMRSRI